MGSLTVDAQSPATTDRAENSRNGGAQRPVYVRPAGPRQWLLTLWVQPGAKRSEVLGPHEGRLRLKIQAPPVEGKANKAVTRFVAELLGLRASQVRLESGQSSRSKVLLIEHPEEPAWHALLQASQTTS